MVYCWRTRDESDASAASTQQQMKVLTQPSPRDHQQSGRNYLVSFVEKTCALASEAGQRQGVLLPVFITKEGTGQSVCSRQPTQQQGKGTHMCGTYRYNVQRGTMDSSVHKTAGDKWQASARRLTQNTFVRCCVENRRQNLDPSPEAKKYTFLEVFGRRAQDAAGNVSPPRPRINLISSGPSSTFTAALPDTQRVGDGLILSRDQRPIVA